MRIHGGRSFHHLEQGSYILTFFVDIKIITFSYKAFSDLYDLCAGDYKGV